MTSKSKSLKAIQNFSNVCKEIERIEERIENAVENADSSDALLNVLKTKVNTYEQKLENSFSNLDVNDSDEKLEKYLEFQDVLFEYAVFLENTKPKNKTESQAVSSNAKIKASKKLPKLELPHFYGDMENWISFKELFQATEYLSLGHMKAISIDREKESPNCYIPYHMIQNDNSSTTKCRVVFNASAKTSNGKSLNNILLIRPKLQTDNFSHLVKFRSYRVAFSADIEKMYRQILIADDDRQYQRIVWRSTPSDPLISYKLQTATYGISCAPFLALRTLQQLYLEEEQTFPIATRYAKNHFYVDDLLAGADTEKEAKTIIAEIQNLMKSGDLVFENVPRFLGIDNNSDIQLHGFCDASTKAFAAVVYLKSRQNQVSLVSAKTRVAPIKQLTIPRLELCGALLLAELITAIEKALSFPIKERYLWTDSTIVLTDCATLGLFPEQLKIAYYWWNGPDWIKQDFHPLVPSLKVLTTNLDEPDSVQKPTSVIADRNPLNDVLFKFSSYTKLIRVLTWVRLFIQNCKATYSTSKSVGLIQAEEVETSLKNLVKLIQQTEFYQGIKCFKMNKLIPKSSKLLPLNIFLDKDGILRVGGRLSKHPTLPYDQKFPIVIPKRHHITPLIIRHFHQLSLHTPELVLSLIRQKFWIPDGRSTIRREIKRSTRAVHLELVSSMSTEAFLAALLRFIAQRGHPTDILSDNGSNFIGSDNYLKQLFKWKSLLQLKHQFWNRWTKSTSSTHLQARRKWHQHRPPLSVGDLVLIQADNMPPLSWPLARTLEIIPGTDGIPRVALLRTPSGPAKRAINRLIALPVPTCRAPEDGDSLERQQMAQ
ncbi:hypothetical protein HNY73_021227 [Argiope bruennichi]|uniref:Uncharacterized protein n=1 Tax=Argiope bruennichi TaxID=94029 RepID=A0A8T0EA94_ARGBR|nr:hypothetical protein HNY73_021227 [Argiope bruennichi]